MGKEKRGFLSEESTKPFTILLAMKIFQFYKTGFAALLVFLTSVLPVSGNPFYNSLPDSKREEIKIIDDHTVEIGIGPDNRSVSCNILDAVQSIPYVGAGGEPDTVFVNKEKVHHFRKGLYTWDREGNYRVRLTTKYIREFGNIQIHIADTPTPKEEPEPVAHKKTTAPPAPELLPSLSEKPETELLEKEFHIEKPKSIPVPESIVTPPVEKEEPFALPSPSSPLVPKKIRVGIVKGFRLAQFGMSEKQVIQAIEADFGLLEKKVERRRDPESGQRVLTIASLTLDPKNGKAWVRYYLSSQDQTLNRVDVIWGHPDHSKVDHTILQKSAERFKNLFRQLETQTAIAVVDKGPYIFYGVDIFGNGIKLMWNKPYDKNFQPISKSEPTLTLSYFQP
ncbi:MAG TPA: hypothetical protein DHW17_00645 [Nitrospina sp.]|nr:hypothetical protein [Nitrospina sp.]